MGGEPPTAIDEPDERELVADLRRELSDADIVRLSDDEWLSDDEFGRNVEALLEYARDHGARVEYA